ncbi:DNA repair protein RecO [Alteromonas sp. ASW11-19]|uniref:DNA repair protein RecO n=1 Tax=Alteromonas salexigens TaxID=2982530 RepID=A0ABT2VJY0_9ALTE|nr:DNA repair protein RecO [Alteromonas salexigens]MCU7553118.1 DNA repair protein RecO [Alteromonas salexigens]
MKNAVWHHAFVLHRRPYRETSYLIDFFTLEQGKVSAVAKGVRNSKGDKKSLLQPFQQIRVQFSGKSELKNLNQTEAFQPALPLTAQALFCGMYVNEVMNRVMPVGLASETLYEAYTEALGNLLTSPDIELSLRQFELALLEDMGQLGSFTEVGDSGAPVRENAGYGWLSEVGIAEAARCPGMPAIPGYALLALAQGEWTPAAKKAAKLINREALKPLLGSKPLKSRELFIRMQPPSGRKVSQ